MELKEKHLTIASERFNQFNSGDSNVRNGKSSDVNLDTVKWNHEENQTTRSKEIDEEIM